MSSEVTHHILCQDVRLAQILEQAFVKQMKLDHVVIHADPLDRESYDAVIGETVTVPLRLGVLRDFLARHKEDSALSILEIGPFRLDVTRYEWSKTGQNSIRLTEKETSVLQMLYGVQGAAISRDILLRDVWEYAYDVESHTIETHIYRLRQKIEDDPGAPAILMTGDEGYYLNPDLLNSSQ